MSAKDSALKCACHLAMAVKTGFIFFDSAVFGLFTTAGRDFPGKVNLGVFPIDATTYLQW
jgi:hypothetical protein